VATIRRGRANVLKTRIEAVLQNWASCAELETILRRLGKSQQVEIDKAHGGFDAADRARVEATLDDLSRRARAVGENINAVTARIAKANGTCSRPTDRIQALCRQYNALVANHNALAAEYSSRVERRNRLASERKGLVETLRRNI
jgi:wobble nucleotide-excising tRNase